MVSEDRQTDLVLVFCPPWDVARPPLNVAYLLAFGKARGFAIDFHDLNISFYNAANDADRATYWDLMSEAVFDPRPVRERYDAPIDSAVERIVAANARCVGFSVHYRNLPFTEYLVARIRERAPGTIILYGGPEVGTAYAAGYLDRLSADGLVIGEGEETLAETLATLRRTGELVPLPGLIAVTGGKRSGLTPRAPIRDLDTLPFPDFTAMDLRQYHPHDHFVTLPFLFSRGCLGRCAFCMDHVLNGGFRARRPESVVAELTDHVRRYGVTQYEFNDLLCNGDLHALEAMADALTRSDLRITWSSYAIVREGLTPRLFAKLKDSGCSLLMFGVDSGSDHVLKLMNKRYDAALAQETIRACAAAGIATYVNFIVGFPGETEDDHRETMAFIRRNRASIRRVCNLGTCMLAPGSAIATRPERYGVRLEGATWSAGGGNTLAVRNRRLEEIRALLRELELPLVVINREPGSATDRARPAAADDAGGKTARITRAATFDAAGRAASEFRVGDRAIVSIEFETATAVTEPLFRAQIFCDDDAYRRGMFVHGTNTARLACRLGRLAAGRGAVELTYERLNLAPGRYRLAVGIWPDETTDAAYDAVEDLVLEIAGTADPAGAVAEMPVRFEFADVGAGGDAARVAELTMKDAAGGSPAVWRTGEALDCEAAFAAPEATVPTVRIYNVKGNLVHRAAADPIAPSGGGVARARVRALNLLEGRYLLVMSLDRPATGERIAAAHAFFEVRSERADGAGLVFQPCAWRVLSLPS